MVVTTVPAMSTHSIVGSPRLGIRLFWVAITAFVSALRPALVVKSEPAWTAVTRAISRAAWDDAVVLVDGPTEVEDGHHQDQEDDDREGELDEGLAALVVPAS